MTNQFGMPAAPAPAVNQFGMPVASGTSQFGLPTSAPVRPPAPAPESGIHVGRLVAVVAAIALAVGGFIWLQGVGKKTSTKVADNVEQPIVQAHQTAEKVDLQQAVQAQETYLSDHSSYATSMSQLTGFVASPSTRITVVSATGTAYCLRADDLSSFHAPSMYVSSAAGAASTTPCT